MPGGEDVRKVSRQDIQLVRARRDKQAKIERTKWWKLKGETSEVFREMVIKEGSWKEEDDINNMWEKMATNIRKVTSEVCGVTKRSGGEAKDTWWWNVKVQRAIKKKKECYRRLYHDKSVDNIEKYKVAKKTAKRAVQNLIERCLQLYMNQKEVVDTLSFQAKIEPSFTELVWQKLEEENRDFFKAYYVRLMLMNQIVAFNKLLEQQYQIMTKDHPSGMPSMPPTAPNGSNSNTLNQNVPFLPDTIPSTAMQDNLLHNRGSSSIVNGAPSNDQFIYAGKVVHGLPGGMDASSSLLAAHNSTVGQFNGHNGTTIKTESGYSSNSDFGFGNENVFLEQSVGDVSGGSFSSSELNGQPLGDPILDMDSSSYGFLSQIPRNFSFSDLTEDFSHSAEILENYGRSPFIPSDANNFPESTTGEHTEIGNRRLDTISEGVHFEDFGSD
ncbi:uncharacterized protein [Miscanthus floridulus]|uniref:uncharacterized protein n=1 Tax=Miscanthus floridulus TaxID=154761 RepID=UPI003457A345